MKISGVREFQMLVMCSRQVKWVDVKVWFYGILVKSLACTSSEFGLIVQNQSLQNYQCSLRAVTSSIFSFHGYYTYY